MTHEEIQADLSSFALGALDADEQREVEQHLAGGCAACQRELAGWQEVVGIMALTSEDKTPPDLKPALMQRLPRRSARIIALPRWSWVPLAAAAVALLVLGVVREAGRRDELVKQRQLVASLRSELATAHDNFEHVSAQLAAKENDLVALRTALAAAQESLAIVQAPGLQLVRLKETPKAQPAEAHVLISAENHRALFYAFDLPPVPPDKAYELWWITEKEGPVSAGVFVPDQKGLGRVETAVPSQAGTIQAAAVTIEPQGGVLKPTGPMVLLGTVALQHS